MSSEQIRYLEDLLSEAFKAEKCKILPVFKGFLAACTIPGKEDEKDLFVFWIHEEKLKGILSKSGISTRSFRYIKTGVSIVGGVLAYGIPGVGLLGGAIAEAGYYLLSKNRRLQLKFGEPPQDNMNFSPKTHFIEFKTYYLSKNGKIVQASEFMKRTKIKLEEAELLKKTKSKLEESDLLKKAKTKLGESNLLKKTKSKLEESDLLKKAKTKLGESELLKDTRSKLAESSKKISISTKNIGSKFSKRLSHHKTDQEIEKQDDNEEIQEFEFDSPSEDVVENPNLDLSSAPEDIVEDPTSTPEDIAIPGQDQNLGLSPLSEDIMDQDLEFELSSSSNAVMAQDEPLSFTKIRFNSQLNILRLQDIEIDLATAGDKVSMLKSAVELVSSTTPTSYTSFDEKNANEFISYLEENGFDIKSLIED
ncbi:MAG: hypothetical protein ACFFBD_06925 [Candidatus Hodarchaeota archaeon]